MSNPEPALPRGSDALRPLMRSVMFGSAAFVFLNFTLPFYGREIGASAVLIGGLFTVFTGALMVGRPVVGWALDRFGRQRFLIAALLFYSVAMVMFSQSQGLGALYLARFVQGLGAAFMWITARTMVADLTEAASRGAAMGRISESSVRGSMLGAMWGFTILGFLPLARAWTIAFAGYAVLTLLGALIAWRRVPETRAIARTETADPFEWSPEIRGLAVVVFAIGFAEALIGPVYLIYLQDKFDVGARVLSIVFVLAGVVYATLPSRTGRLADRFGRRPIMALGLLMAACLTFLVPLVPTLSWLIGLYALLAVGWCLVDPARDAWIGDLAGESERGRTYGALEFCGATGAAVGPLVGGLAYDRVSELAPFVLNAGILLFTAAGILMASRMASRDKSITSRRLPRA